MFGWNEWDTFFTLASFSVGGAIGVFFNAQWYVVLALALLTGGIGVALVNAAPTYANVREFASILAYYSRQENEIKNQTEASVSTDNVLLKQFKTPKTTREITNIKRFIPKYGLVERTTGEFQVMLRFYAPNNDFAQKSDIIQIVDAIEEWATTDVDFESYLFATTKSVEANEYLTALQSRRYDHNTPRSVVEQELLKDMASTEAYQIEESAEVAEYYFLFDVTVEEAAEDYVGDKSSLQRAAETPIIGALLQGFVDTQEELTEEEKYEQMLRVIRRRTSKMQQIAEGLSDVRVDPVPVRDYIQLMYDFQNGQERDIPGPRTQPAVTVNEPEEY